MTNKRAFGEFQILDEQIDIAAPLKIPKQILLIAQDDVVRQLAKTLHECGLGNRIRRRRHYAHLVCLVREGGR